MNYRISALPILVFLAILYFLYNGLYKDPTLIPSPLIGKTLPEFKSTSLIHSRDINNTDLLGKNYLLNVWASWCYGCSVEHDYLLDIYNDNKILIYGLNYKDDKKSAITWLKEKGNPYKDIIVDYSGDIGIDLGVYGAPETFLINSDGLILLKHVGPISSDFYEKNILPLLLK